MSCLAHFWLAGDIRTSICGQFLGDYVEGPDLTCFDPTFADGIRLHRAIDRISDNQPEYRVLRHQRRTVFSRLPGDGTTGAALAGLFEPILTEYAALVESRIVAGWPDNAPFSGQRIRGLSSIVAGYDSPHGIRPALAGVEKRLKRSAPIVASFDEIEALTSVFDAYLPGLMMHMQCCIRQNPRAC